MADENTTNQAANQPPIQAAINWGALFKSPFFWGLVVGIGATLVVQDKWKKRGGFRIGGGEAPRREPRIVNPE